jgi:tRNA-2-methylthio-N6-dimethylallyladenosine synthase
LSNKKSNINIMVSNEELDKQLEYAAIIKSILCTRHKKEKPLAQVRTFGCQGNVSDGERLKGMLCEMGYEITEDTEKADLVLLNTCAIREHAQDRVLGNIGALKHLKESKPGFLLALCGCMMQQEYVADKIKKSYPYVDLVFGTHVTYKLPELIFRCISGERQIFELPDSDGIIAEGLPQKRDSDFKAWLPIMYGCDNYCSYCVVPYVRGRERSRETDTIIREAKELVASGYKEITLLGQNVNSYGKGENSSRDFSDLLRELNAISADFIIRFMTSNPKDCSRKLLDTMADCSKVAKHLHLPFQSGNDRILKAMNRGYTREQYLELIRYARKVMPGLSITSDVIVGFPGESYQEFCDTLSLVEQARFTSMFTFIFSPREGTAAALLPDAISREEKVRWFKELTSLQEINAAARTAQMKGKIFRVLCESRAKQDSDIFSGRTECNIIIEFPATSVAIGTFQYVRVTEASTWMVKGELVGNGIIHSSIGQI